MRWVYERGGKERKLCVLMGWVYEGEGKKESDGFVTRENGRKRENY